MFGDSYPIGGGYGFCITFVITFTGMIIRMEFLNFFQKDYIVFVKNKSLSN